MTYEHVIAKPDRTPKQRLEDAEALIAAVLNDVQIVYAEIPEETPTDF